MKSSFDCACRQTVDDLVAEQCVDDDGRNNGDHDRRKHFVIVCLIRRNELGQSDRKRLLVSIRDEDQGQQQFIQLAIKVIRPVTKRPVLESGRQIEKKIL